jgi:hypothetical protein
MATNSARVHIIVEQRSVEEFHIPSNRFYSRVIDRLKEKDIASFPQLLEDIYITVSPRQHPAHSFEKKTTQPDLAVYLMAKDKKGNPIEYGWLIEKRIEDVLISDLDVERQRIAFKTFIEKTLASHAKMLRANPITLEICDEFSAVGADHAGSN